MHFRLTGLFFIQSADLFPFVCTAQENLIHHHKKNFLLVILGTSDMAHGIKRAIHKHNIYEDYHLGGRIGEAKAINWVVVVEHDVKSVETFLPQMLREHPQAI